MIILAPGALEEIFSETSSKDSSAGVDSRFSAWLKSPSQDGPAASSVTTPYKKRLTRFE